MEPVSDKVLAGVRFWPALTQKLIESELTLGDYYRLIRRDSATPHKSFPAPKISEMPALFKFLRITPADIFKEIGRDDYLPPFSREILPVFCRLDTQTIKALTEAAYLSVGSWIYDCTPNNPACRLLVYVDRHIIPKSSDDFYVYNLKNKYRDVKKSQVPDEEMPEWLIGNSKRLPSSSNNIDIETWLDTAKKLDVSLRWLYNYDTNASFYGYSPEVETFYDIWTLANKDVRQMLWNVARTKLTEHEN